MDDDDIAMDDDDIAMDDDDAIDMTDASDEEVLKVFKAMGDDDGIIVKKDDDFIHLSDDDDEYLIQLGESMVGDDELEEDDYFKNETIYEIELDDKLPEMDEDMSYDYSDSLEEDMYSDFNEESDPYANKEDPYADSLEEELYESKKSKKSIKPKGTGIGRGPKFSYDKKPNMGGGFSEKKKEAFGKGTKAMGTGKAKFEYKEGVNMVKGSMEKVEGKKSETKEAARTIGNGSKNGSRGLRKGRMNNRNYEYNPFKISEGRSNEEVQLLKEKNEEYKQALDVFRTKLTEVAVFNSNLAYATRLFTEHSTTKQEKINILRRFDNVESLKESKNLYRVIKGELSSSGSVGEQKINESIERTVNKTVETGSSVNLIESKTYENPQFLRMKDLMGKLK